MDHPASTEWYTGTSLRRLEDRRLLVGGGRFLDDIALPRMRALAFVRSPHAHGRIDGIDDAAAIAAGARVFTASDLGPVVRPVRPRVERPGFVPTQTGALADGLVQYCGEPVAAVVAGDPYTAADACELVVVRYEALKSVTTANDAIAAGHLLFSHRYRQGDVDGAFASAPVVLRERFAHGRCAASPIELRGLIAAWDGDSLHVWAGTQRPHVLRSTLAASLGLAETRVRVIAPDVGGSFGLKTTIGSEELAVAAIARITGTAVKWVETRRENLTAAPQARESAVEVELAADREGRILAIRARVVSDAGARHVYPATQLLEPMGSASMLPGPYRVPAYAYEVLVARTHKPPIGAYRGVGMTMAVFAMERMMDLLAARLGVDPPEVRRRNLLARDAYPATSASGLVYDSGDVPALLEKALAVAGYDEVRAAQARESAAAPLVGIGLACFTEWTALGAEAYRRRGMFLIPGPDSAVVTVEPDGTVSCTTSLPTQGQGHATVFAQIVADGLGVTPDAVRLGGVDTAATPAGSGTMASRGAVTLSGLAVRAVDVLRTKVRAIAAKLLEASAEDIVIGPGGAYVRGVPARAVTIADIARAAYTPPLGGLPPGVEPGLTASVGFDPPGPVFSTAVHVAVVEIDRDTGRVKIRRFLVVEDCGAILNPTLAEGQVHGGVTQGIGEALLERLVHDGNGQVLTATLMDYGIPRADDVPSFDVDHLVTPSPWTPLGVKGMAEGGTVGAPAAIVNAIADALGPGAATLRRLPVTVEEVAVAQTERAGFRAPDTSCARRRSAFIPP